jgi:glutamate N-acetyltransferase / amino-acid N-acetyltransferase
MTFLRSRWVEPPSGVEELDPADLASGFRAAGLACGIKEGGEPDLGLVVCDAADAASAALLTSNAAAAAPIRVCRDRARLDATRAVVVNSGNANAATGKAGYENAVRMQEAAARTLGLDPDRVAVASTGVIGEKLPIDEVEAGIATAASRLVAWGGRRFGEAITTTDRWPKHCALRCDGVTVSAQAKGGGMISPAFATTLCFVQTDAVVADPSAALGAATSSSFERITVDGQQSTNDAIFLMASGEARGELPDGLLEAALLQLAIDVVADGEGATRVGRVEVREAASAAEAEAVARAIADSSLVKTALYGRDPNWGRVVAAAGMALAGEDIDLGPDSVDAEELSGEGDEAELILRLGRGEESAHVYFSDLTPAYIALNAEYTT